MKSKSQDTLERKKIKQDSKLVLASKNIAIISQLHAAPKTSSHLGDNIVIQTPQEVPETYRALLAQNNKSLKAVDTAGQNYNGDNRKEVLIHSERNSQKSYYKRSPSLESQLHLSQAHKQLFKNNIEYNDRSSSTRNSVSKKDFFPSQTTTNTPKTSNYRTIQKLQQSSQVSGRSSPKISSKDCMGAQTYRHNYSNQNDKLATVHVDPKFFHTHRGAQKKFDHNEIYNQKEFLGQTSASCITGQKKSSPNILNYVENRQDAEVRIGDLPQDDNPIVWEDLKSLYQKKRKENTKVTGEDINNEHPPQKQVARPFSSYGSQQTTDESPQEKFSVGEQSTNLNHFYSNKNLLPSHAPPTKIHELLPSHTLLDSNYLKSQNYPLSARNTVNQHEYLNEEQQSNQNDMYRTHRDSKNLKFVLPEKYEVLTDLLKTRILDQLKANPNAKFLDLRKQVQKINKENWKLDPPSKSQSVKVKSECGNAKNLELNSHLLGSEKLSSNQEEKNLRTIFEQTKAVLNSYKIKEKQWKVEKIVLLKEIQQLRSQVNFIK